MNQKQELLCQASRMTDLSAFCDIAYEILENPVFIEDRSGVTLGFSSNVETEAPEWKEQLCNDLKLTPSAAQIREVDALFQDAFSKKGALLIQSDNFMATPRMIIPLMIQQEHAATMVCPAYCKEFEEGDECLFEILASFATTIIYNHKYVITENHHRIDNFLIKLLMGADIPMNSIRLHLGDLQWDAFPFHYILLPCPQSIDDVPRMPLYEIMETLRQQKDLHPLIFDNRVVCICSSKAPVVDWAASFPVLTSALEKYRMFACVSRSFENPGQLQFFYRQTLALCSAAGTLKRNTLVYSYNDYASFLMFEQMDRQGSLRDYCHEKILLLEQYDKKHQTDFLPTLHCYLTCGCNIGKTAESLFIHRNTLTYRLQKCFEILGREPDDSDFFFACVFSMYILEYENKKYGKMPHTVPSSTTSE